MGEGGIKKGPKISDVFYGRPLVHCHFFLHGLQFERNSILLHSGLNPAWHFWLSTRFSCCLKLKPVENIFGYIPGQFNRFWRGCKPRRFLKIFEIVQENILQCSKLTIWRIFWMVLQKCHYWTELGVSIKNLFQSTFGIWQLKLKFQIKIFSKSCFL